MPSIKPITMPKWGLSMNEGMLARWTVEDGAKVARGQEIMDIETDKIANAFESPEAGILRRVRGEGETVPVGALLGTVSDPDVAEADLARFVQEFQERFTPEDESEAAGPTPDLVEAGQYRIRRLRAGTDGRDAILMIHGFGADLSTWMFNQADLATGRQVDAIDLPGHGGSSKEVTEGSVEALADAVLSYMDAAALDAVHIVGHSLGGAVGIILAGKEPSRITGLSLIAPAGLGPEISGGFIEGFLTQTRPRKLRPIIEMLVEDPAAVTADMVEGVLRLKRLDGAQAALRTIASACFDGSIQRVSLRDRLAGMTVPVQVLWGEADRIIPAAHAGGLPAGIATLTIPRAGHIVHMEKAGQVNRAIEEFAGAR